MKIYDAILNYHYLIHIIMPESPNFNYKIDNKKIIKLFYTALMTFLVFTFANDLLRRVIEDSRTEYILYLVFWVALVIQTTFAYRHIMAIRPEKYKVLILVSDCIDVVIEIFVCAVITSTYNSNNYHDMTDYRLLSIPFMLLALNQMFWYSGVNERNIRAIIRLIILFVGMLTVTVLESICHSIYNLAIFVIVHALAMAILRAFDETKHRSKKHKKGKQVAESKINSNEKQ